MMSQFKDILSKIQKGEPIENTNISSNLSNSSFGTALKQVQSRPTAIQKPQTTTSYPTLSTGSDDEYYRKEAAKDYNKELLAPSGHQLKSLKTGEVIDTKQEKAGLTSSFGRSLWRTIGQQTERTGFGVIKMITDRFDPKFSEEIDKKIVQGERDDSKLRKEIWTDDGKYDANEILSLAGSGIGSVGTSIALSIVNPTLAPVVFGIMQGSDTYIDAKKNGASNNKALGLAALDGTVSGLLEKVQMDFLFGKYFNGLKPGLKIGSSIIGEVGQELSQQYASNIIARVGYDKSRDILEGTADTVIATLFGATAGTVPIHLARNNGVKHLQSQFKDNGVDINSKEANTVYDKVYDTVLKRKEGFDKIVKDEITSRQDTHPSIPQDIPKVQTVIDDGKMLKPTMVKGRLENDIILKLKMNGVSDNILNEIKALPTEIDSPGKFYTMVSEVLKKHNVYTPQNINSLKGTTGDFNIPLKDPTIQGDLAYDKRSKIDKFAEDLGTTPKPGRLAIELRKQEAKKYIEDREKDGKEQKTIPIIGGPTLLEVQEGNKKVYYNKATNEVVGEITKDNGLLLSDIKSTAKRMFKKPVIKKTIVKQKPKVIEVKRAIVPIQKFPQKSQKVVSEVKPKKMTTDTLTQEAKKYKSVMEFVGKQEKTLVIPTKIKDILRETEKGKTAFDKEQGFVKVIKEKYGDFIKKDNTIDYELLGITDETTKDFITGWEDLYAYSREPQLRISDTYKSKLQQIYKEAHKEVKETQVAQLKPKSETVKPEVKKVIEKKEIKKPIIKDATIKFQKTIKTKDTISSKEVQKQIKAIPFFKDLEAKQVDKILTPKGKEAFGVYRKGIVEYVNNPDKTTLPHEAFHTFLDQVVSPEKKQEILNLVSERGDSVLATEEKLSQQFAEWFVSKKRPTNKLEQFFNWIANKMREFVGNISEIDKVFNQVVSPFAKAKYDGKGETKFQEKIKLSKPDVESVRFTRTAIQRRLNEAKIRLKNIDKGDIKKSLSSLKDISATSYGAITDKLLKIQKPVHRITRKLGADVKATIVSKMADPDDIKKGLSTQIIEGLEDHKGNAMTFRKLQHWLNDTFRGSYEIIYKDGTPESINSIDLLLVGLVGKNTTKKGIELAKIANKTVVKQLSEMEGGEQIVKQIKELSEINYKSLTDVFGDNIKKIDDYFYGNYKFNAKIKIILAHYKTTQKMKKKKTIAMNKALLEIKDDGMEQGYVQKLKSGKEVPAGYEVFKDPLLKGYIADETIIKYVDNITEGDKYGNYKFNAKTKRILAHYKTTQKMKKKKTILGYGDAYGLGLRLKDSNPISNLLSETKAIAMNKALLEIKDDGMEQGYVQKLKSGKEVPAGYEVFKDPLLKGYIADETIIKYVDNITEADKTNQIGFTKGLKTFNTYARMTMFMFSGFHLINTLMQTIVDTPKILSLQGFKDIGEAFKRYSENVRGMTKKYSDIELLVNKYVNSDNAKQRETTTAFVKLMDKVFPQEIFGTSVKKFNKIFTFMPELLFNHIIPEIKLIKGVNQYNAILEKTGEVPTEAQLQDIAVEQQNIYGMMNEKILYGRSSTALSMIRFLQNFPGFSEGNVNSTFRALNQSASLALNKVKPMINQKLGTEFKQTNIIKGPKATHKQLRSINNVYKIIFLSMVVAQILSIAFTGKGPREPKEGETVADYLIYLMSIRTNAKDKYGNNIVHMTSSIGKDYVKFFSGIASPIKEGPKVAIDRFRGTLAPSFKAVTDIGLASTGRPIVDYKGDRVTKATDSAVKRFIDATIFEVKRFKPYAVSSFITSREKGLGFLHSLASSVGSSATTEEYTKKQNKARILFNIKKWDERQYFYNEKDIEQWNAGVDRLFENQYIDKAMEEEFSDLYIDKDKYLQNKVYDLTSPSLQEGADNYDEKKRKKIEEILKGFNLSYREADKILSDYWKRKEAEMKNPKSSSHKTTVKERDARLKKIF